MGGLANRGRPNPSEANMGTTRIEQAIDEIDTSDGDFEPTCDDIRLAWLTRELSVGHDFDNLWTDR
jgi:hypothetical protein